MREVAIDAEHPSHERERPGVLARITFNLDRQRSRVELSDPHD